MNPELAEELRVMIVDDAADIRLLVRFVLSKEGFSVTEASDGVEALDLLGQGPRPDVLLLDVEMPGLDGWETLTAIRRDPSLARLPVLLCTAMERGPERLKGWALGCDGFVPKPIPLARLASDVRAVVDHSRALARGA